MRTGLVCAAVGVTCWFSSPVLSATQPEAGAAGQVSTRAVTDEAGAAGAAASRPAVPVEAVREGILCPVVADTQVSFYRSKGENERVWNYGRAEQLKLKGFEEYTLLKFDTSACKGMTVRRATLYLPKTEQCEPSVIAPSTVSADWAEGTGQGNPGEVEDQAAPSTGGATALRAVHPDRTWAGPGSNLKWVIFGEGGSLYGARKAGRAADADGEYIRVEMPLDVMQALLVEGDSYGICITEEKGQRAFNKTYIDPPNPNHFIGSREAGRGSFLIVEGERVDTTPPGAIRDAAARPGAEAGEITLTWTCPGEDGSAGGKALGYRVYLSTEAFADEAKSGAEGASQAEEASLAGKARPARQARLDDDTLLPRCVTYRPDEPGRTQVFPVYDLEPGTQYHFAVIAYDEAGNLSEPAFFAGRTRETRKFALQPHPRTIGKGGPLTSETMRVWACPSNSKINPVTGGSLAGGKYTGGDGVNPVALGNEAWDGEARAVTLFAGRNDFAGFHLVLDKKVDRPLSNIVVRVSDLSADEGKGRIAAENVEIFRQWSSRDEGGVYWPDALLPVAGPLAIPDPTNKIEGQRAQPLYVDVYVPHDAAPGAYTGRITVEADGMAALDVPVQLKVWRFTLPDTLSFWPNMYNYSMPRFKGPDQWAGVLNMFRLAHRNRLNLKIIPHSHSGNFTNPYMAMETTGDGKDRRVVSFERFDEHYGPLLTGEAFADMPRKGVPIADVTLPIFENWPVKLSEGFTFDPYGVHLDIREDFTQEYADGFKAVCRQMADHFKKMGYTDNIFEVVFRSKYQYAPTTTFWLLDEPMFRDDYLAINYFVGLTREGFAGADPVKVRTRIDCSRVEESHGLLDKVDWFCGTIGNLREYYRPMRDFMDSYIPQADGQGRTLWVYGSTNKVTTSNVANRAWSIEAWLFGADSVLPWLAFGPDGAYDKAASADQAVFYPGARFDVNGVLGSLRMKAFRDGQQDVECLVLLADALGATRKEVAGLLAGVAQVQGQFVVERPEAAETISYSRMTPDDLARLRRVVGYNLDVQAARRAGQ